ncbi:MAG: AMP-binding protein [Firmicutes bacterium]|nr:AMP-binding protein [Bacillota bacterium]
MAWEYEGDTIHAILHRNAHVFPEKIFLRYKDKHWTFAKWDEYTSRLAQGFLAMGVSRGDWGALLLANSPEVFADVTALDKIGAIPMPVNIQMKPEKIVFMLNDTETSLAVVDGRAYEAFMLIEHKSLPCEARSSCTLRQWGTINYTKRCLNTVSSSKRKKIRSNPLSFSTRRERQAFPKGLW